MMPLEIAWAMTVSWWAGDLMCRLCSFVRIFGLFLSSNIVVCISIDRYTPVLVHFYRSSKNDVVPIGKKWFKNVTTVPKSYYVIV